MQTIRSVTAVLVLLLGIPLLVLAQSTQMQPQRPGMGPGQVYPGPGQPPAYDPGALPPSRGVPGAS